MHDASKSSMAQQEFLRAAMDSLGMSQAEFATRLGTSERRLAFWLLPSDAKDYRELDEVIWKYVREILAQDTAKKSGKLQ